MVCYSSNGKLANILFHRHPSVSIFIELSHFVLMCLTSSTTYLPETQTEQWEKEMTAKET